MFTFVLETANTLDTQKTSNDIRESLQKLQEEIDYTLIASKIPQQYRGLNNLSFLKSIPWFCVFDLFDQKSRTDGLYYILNETNDSARVSAKNLGDFNDPTTDLSKRVTTWILRDQLMHESDWTRYSKKCLYKALSTCYDGSLARKHWVFLCLSDECLAETADVIDYLFTILGKDANKYITIISEKKEIGEKIIKYLKDSIRKDLKYPCSFFGMPLDLLKTNVREMLGPNNFHDPKATTDLPHLGGLTAVLNKRINSLTHLEVYCPKSSLTPSVKEIKEARDDFYKGDAIQQVNLFHRHDIERTLQDKLTRQIDSRLKKLSSLYEQEYTGFVETVNLSYEPGSGATTLCRRILWDKRETYRCAVVKTIETDITDYQINELQKFSYETGSSFIPPVLILVDKFPEQNVFRLIDKLSERKTKCVLLNTIPITNVVMGSEDDNAELSQLDDVEIERVKKILVDVEDKDDEKKRAAEERLKRERRFIWLGLELFGRQCVDIEDRLSNHIQQFISYSITNRLQDAYEMILYFCCFLDYYSKGQFIYPHSCILDILDENYGLDNECTDQIVYIHDKFGGLLLEDYSGTGCYRGWRPAHFLVGEVIRKKMDLVTTVKKFFTERKNNDTYAKKNLIKNIVHTCLQRDSIYKNSPTSEDDPDLTIEEDDFGEKQKYSTLLLDAMHHHTSESEMTNALDILIAINVNVETDEQKAHSSQQLARILAYEVGVKKISHKDASLLSQLSLPCIDQISTDSSASGFEVAHQVINLAVTLQPHYAPHLVTKGTFFKTELQSKLLETNRPDFASRKLQDFVEEAINITKKGISLYNSALEKTPHDDTYLYAMIGKIQIIIILLEIFKNLPCFSVGGQRPDESFKLYMTFGKHPEELNSTLSEDDLKYFLSLRTTPSQLLDELFEATEERRKQLLKKHKMQKIKNANRRGEFLRKKFYDVTKLDRTPLANNNRVSKEDIVQDILYKHEETSYSGWKKLDLETINQIYEYSKQAIAKETTNDKVMLIYAKAALKQSNVVLDDLSEHVKNWCTKYPMSRWANLFNYMIKFPVPNGSLKANVPAVNHSIQICKSKARFPPNEYRKSSAEYFLGKGSGINAILPSHEFEDSSKKQEMKTANGGRRRDVRDTQFWRSKDVYKKLERLCGQKVLGKKGVLDYTGVEIMFDNERYPKESRDDLWFCLGFTLNGPYAYDPVDEDTFNTIKQGFSEEKKMYSDAINSRACSPKTSEKASKLATPTTSTSPLPSNSTVRLPKRPGKEMTSRERNKDAWKTNENQRKQGFSEEDIVCSDATNSRVCSTKTSEKASKSGAPTFSTSPLSSDFTISPKRPGKEVTSSARNKDSLETNENQRKQGFSEEDIVCSDATNSRVCSPKTSEKASKSDDFTISPKRPGKEMTSRARNKDTWKTNKKLTLRIHTPDGHQLSLEPQRIDPKGRVMHAAQVTGAPKSVICKIPSERCSSGKCAFAHPTMDDPIKQTVCILCTKNNQDSCNKKIEHAEHIYDLGQFLNMSGEFWRERGAYYRLDKI